LRAGGVGSCRGDINFHLHGLLLSIEQLLLPCLRL
jgi:hypothetical protein